MSGRTTMGIVAHNLQYGLFPSGLPGQHSSILAAFELCCAFSVGAAGHAVAKVASTKSNDHTNSGFVFQLGKALAR